MDEFFVKLADLLEVDRVVPTDRFDNFDVWDSLTILSIIAFCKTDFGLSLSSKDIIGMETPGNLFEYLQSRQQQ